MSMCVPLPTLSFHDREELFFTHRRQILAFECPLPPLSLVGLLTAELRILVLVVLGSHKTTQKQACTYWQSKVSAATGTPSIIIIMLVVKPQCMYVLIFNHSRSIIKAKLPSWLRKMGCSKELLLLNSIPLVYTLHA